MLEKTYRLLYTPGKSPKGQDKKKQQKIERKRRIERRIRRKTRMKDAQSIRKELKKLNAKLRKSGKDIQTAIKQDLGNIWAEDTRDKIQEMQEIIIDMRDYLNQISITDHEGAIMGTSRLISFLKKPEATKKWDGKLPQYVGAGSVPFVNIPSK